MTHSSEIEKLERRWMDNPMGVTFAPLAEAYRRAGEQSRALEVLAIGLSQHPAYVPALIVQARCHLDTRSDRAAEESFRAVLQSDPHNLIALKGLADICERTERAGDSLGFINRLLDADPSHEEARHQHTRLTGLLADRAAILATAAAATGGSVADEAAAVPDLEPTAYAGGGLDDPATLGSLLDSPEEATPSAPTDELAAVGGSAGDSVSDPITEFAIEKETSPFDGFDAVNWAGDLVDHGEAPDLPFEEQALAPAAPEPEISAEPPPPETSIESPPLLASELEGFVGEQGGVAAEGPEETAVIAMAASEPIAFETIPLSSLLPLEEEGHFNLAMVPPAAALDPGVPATEAPILDAGDRSAAPIEDDPISAAAEGLEPILPAGSEIMAEAPPAVTGGWIAEFGHTEFVPALDDSPAVATPSAEELEPVAEWPAATSVAEVLPAPVALEPDPPAATPAMEPEPVSGSDSPLHEPAARVPEESDDVVMVVEGAEAETPTDAPEEPSATEPELVITETMAEIFQRQGHRALALAVYAQLAERDPANPRLAEAVARLKRELAPPATGATGGGESVGAFLARVLSTEPAAPAAPIAAQTIEPATTGAPTQPSRDPLSLSAIFGDDPALAGIPIPAAAGDAEAEPGPSFDEFFGPTHAAQGAAATGGASGAEDDLEQFNAWLRGLKR